MSRESLDDGAIKIDLEPSECSTTETVIVKLTIKRHPEQTLELSAEQLRAIADLEPDKVQKKRTNLSDETPQAISGERSQHELSDY